MNFDFPISIFDVSRQLKQKLIYWTAITSAVICKAKKKFSRCSELKKGSSELKLNWHANVHLC